MSFADKQIKSWISNKEYFSGRCDGNGLYLMYRPTFEMPSWYFRYSFSGEDRKVTIGSYSDVSIAEARAEARRLKARVTLGYDVALEKQDLKRETLRKIRQDKDAFTVTRLATEYYERKVLKSVKHPQIVKGKIDKDIIPNIGKLRVEEVMPKDIDDILKLVLKRNAPAAANKILGLLKNIFNYAIKMHLIDSNPAFAFDKSDAGGKEKKRSRVLSEQEITTLFEAMKSAKGFSRTNELTLKLLLATAVRKEELIAARWEEFDLENSVWHLPAIRTKNGIAIDIPLAVKVVEWLQELKRISTGNQWVLPARKIQTTGSPYICTNTLNVALSKVKHGLPHFTVHDFRRTARTQIAKLGTPPHIAERCLNHKIAGVEGVYDQYDYFEERKKALFTWTDLLVQIEAGKTKVVPIKSRVNKG